LRPLTPINPIFWKKNVWPLCTAWPKKLWPLLKRSVTKYFVLAVFRTFSWNPTNLQHKTSAHSTVLYRRVGWVWTFFYIFNKSTPEIFYTPSKSTENSENNFFTHVTTFWVMHYIYMGPKCLFTIWTSWVEKKQNFTYISKI
jgi:hypothetical protein